MPYPAPTEPSADSRYTSARYFELVAEGALSPDDRVELLGGVVVAMSPQNPRHAAGVHWVSDALRVAVGSQGVVRVQAPLVAGPYSVPEADVAVVPGRREDYLDAHPTTALLVVEVADWTLIQDWVTKATIYAAACIPEYWIVNLRDDQVEVLRPPATTAAAFETIAVAHRGQRLELAALPGVTVAIEELLPTRHL